MTHNASRRSLLARRGLALALSAALVASCSVTSHLPSSGSSSPNPTPEPTATTSPPTAPTTTVTPVPPAELAPVPAPFAIAGTPAEQATAIAAALADPDADRTAVALAAFEAAGFPVLLADGTSLTSTTDPVGLPWSVVASAATLSGPQARVSLRDLTSLLAMVDPLADFDATAAANATAAAMRAELATPTAPGPTLVAQLVAAESRLYDGTELADPAVTADQLHVSATTALLIGTGVIRLTTVLLAEAGELGSAAATAPAAPASSAGSGLRSGFARDTNGSRHTLRPTQLDTSTGCDDGLGGWGLWVSSKFATGFTLGPQLGVVWNGFYGELGLLGINRGLNDDVFRFADGLNNVTAVVFAVVNVAVFLSQVMGRNTNATMDGDGPLVRTKTTGEDGSARRITLTIDYNDGDQHTKNVRNCILAAMAALGNNTQLPTGPAVGVVVETSGATGFSKSLAAGNSYMLFGPGAFQIEQTTDASGSIVVPVMGRRQRIDKTNSTTAVYKQFGVYFEASLDPNGASQLGRAFADDVLCLGSIATAQVVAAIAECQNAVIDILKQFHWDIGEYKFPLQDWENGGWRIDGHIAPYDITGIKCDGVGGLWFLNLLGALDGGSAEAIIEGEMDEATGTGTYVMDGIASGGGVSIPLTGSGTLTFVQTGPDTAQLIIEGSVNSGGMGGGTIELTRDSCE